MNPLALAAVALVVVATAAPFVAVGPQEKGDAPAEAKGTRVLAPGMRLSDEEVASFARLALAGIFREYPNKPSNVMTGPESVQSPSAMHPAFYGSFDWHSSVHGHWMLLRLLKLYPEGSMAGEIRRALGTSLTPEKIAAETAYFDEKLNQPFERPYGWAWALRLAAELRTFDDPDGKRWAEAFAPLEARIVELLEAYLPRLTWPLRTGEHPDTGFALAQALDYARIVGRDDLAKKVAARARDFYFADRDYPARYEPSGQDFFSSGLNEADLMRRVLSKDEFSRWLDGFFPTLASGKLGNLLEPAIVSDVTDGKLVHLAGLNLNRAWTMDGVARALPNGDARRKVLEEAVRRHCEAGLGYVFSGHYEGEHWLASFAVYLLSEAGIAGS